MSTPLLVLTDRKPLLFQVSWRGVARTREFIRRPETLIVGCANNPILRLGRPNHSGRVTRYRPMMWQPKVTMQGGQKGVKFPFNLPHAISEEKAADTIVPSVLNRSSI